MQKQIKAEFLPRTDDIEVMFPDEEPEQITAAEQAAQAAIEQLSSNAEKGKTIRIFRQMGSGKESMEFVAKYPADKYTVDDLIDKIKYEYGGGDYRFMIYNEKGKLVANKLVCIAKKSTLKPGGDNGGDVYSVMSHMMDKQDEFMRRMMAGNNQNNSRMDFMQEMLMMKQLFTNDSAGNNGAIGHVKETLELMTMLREEANPKEEESGGFTKMISEALPLFSEMAKASNNQVRPQQPPPQHTPNPQRRTRKQPTEDKNVNMQKMAISQLVAKASAGENPADVAEQLSFQLPTSFIPQIEALVLAPDAFEKICALNVNVSRHAKWFKEVIEWIKGYLGHPCQFDSEFDNDSENDDNVVNSTTDAVIPEPDGKTKFNNDGDSERKSGDISNA